MLSLRSTALHLLLLQLQAHLLCIPCLKRCFHVVFKWLVNAEVHRLQVVCAVGWYIHNKNIVGCPKHPQPKESIVPQNGQKGPRPTTTEVALVCGMFPQQRVWWRCWCRPTWCLYLTTAWSKCDMSVTWKLYFWQTCRSLASIDQLRSQKWPDKALAIWRLSSIHIMLSQHGLSLFSQVSSMKQEYTYSWLVPINDQLRRDAIHGDNCADVT